MAWISGAVMGHHQLAIADVDVQLAGRAVAPEPRREREEPAHVGDVLAAREQEVAVAALRARDVEADGRLPPHREALHLPGLKATNAPLRADKDRLHGVASGSNHERISSAGTRRTSVSSSPALALRKA